VLDLGSQPLSNALLSAEQLQEPEVTYPLKVYRCNKCGLVQLPMHATRETIFEQEYVYLSGYSKTWREHCRAFAREMKDRRKLGASSVIYEIASNDGTLLKEVQKLGITQNVCGIEPAKNVAEIARKNNVPTVNGFFGAEMVERLHPADRPPADLIVANNVLAHVPDLHDFVRGMKCLLSPSGCISIEVPWLLNLIEGCQWDTVYHEHFSYFSIEVLWKLFAEHELAIREAVLLPTHGGSLRIIVEHDRGEFATLGCHELMQREVSAGISDGTALLGFQEEVDMMKYALLEFLIEQKKCGFSVLGFGAAAKGNTLLNYAGVRPDLLAFIVDDNPLKQGRFTPGTQIPILDTQALIAAEPHYVLVLPWNVGADARERLSPLLESGSKLLNPRLEPV